MEVTGVQGDENCPRLGGTSKSLEGSVPSVTWEMRLAC